MLEKWNVRHAYGDGSEWQDAMVLAWRTFLKFEADDYTLEGIDAFRDFVTDSNLYRMYRVGSYELIVAYDGRRMIGMITLRNISHISLLFVEEAYHKRGVGSSLIYYARDYLISETVATYMTVDSSPYGLGFYKRLGFVPTDDVQKNKGIIFTPMRWDIR